MNAITPQQFIGTLISVVVWLLVWHFLLFPLVEWIRKVGSPLRWWIDRRVEEEYPDLVAELIYLRRESEVSAEWRSESTGLRAQLQLVMTENQALKHENGMLRGALTLPKSAISSQESEGGIASGSVFFRQSLGEPWKEEPKSRPGFRSFRAGELPASDEELARREYLKNPDSLLGEHGP
jgi:hypothetical protein